MLSTSGLELISVVAGGYSVTEVDLDRIPGHVVGVNDSAYRLPRVDRVVTMDRLWTENRRSWLMERKLPTYLRSGTVRDPELESQPWVTSYTCDYRSVAFGPDERHMNGTNSAVVALNLAFLLRPKTLYLFGFDMCRGPQDQAHWHPDYPWNVKSTKQGKLKEWGSQFASVAAEFKNAGIEVANVSSRSRITQFRRVTAQELGIGRRDVA